MFQFRYRHVEPLEPNGLRTLTWMLQSEKYVPSADWILGRSGRRVDRGAFEVMWRIARDPKSATMADAAKIFVEYERDMSPLQASVNAWNQDGCDEFDNFAEASIEVERLSEMRARRVRDDNEFLASGQAAADQEWDEAHGGGRGDDDSGGDHTDDDGEPL